MAQITVDDTLFGALGAAAEEPELLNSKGQRVGYFMSDKAYRRLVCRSASAQASDRELERCRQETEEYSTADVLDRLQNL